ncbi:hypothetical protein V5E97_00525 [Singulisphaera sp. Ch08]|uniref:DUF883 domain-containing protein n=1 Tax=Singulisphaera sp. Ch08 TaxID=3120278 RepID=A0AAU7CHH0_9BACT
MIDRMQGLEANLRPQAEELKERALEYAATARERLAEGSGMIKEYVVKEPARALGIALGVGVLLGWMIKRK